MSNIIIELRKIISSSCLATIMKRTEGCQRYCEVKITNKKLARIIIDLDEPGSFMSEHESRPDYILVCSDLKMDERIVVVEISMGGNKDTKIIAKQLQAGLQGIEREMSKLSDKISFSKFKIFALFCGATDRNMREKLGKEKIYFNNKRISIKVMRCGESLDKKIYS